jgi:hypothetical protein
MVFPGELIRPPPGGLACQAHSCRLIDRPPSSQENKLSVAFIAERIPIFSYDRSKARGSENSLTEIYRIAALRAKALPCGCHRRRTLSAASML